MNDEKMMKVLREIVLCVCTILIIITVVLEYAAFEKTRNIFLCSCILMLLTIAIVFDTILKDNRRKTTHCIWYVIWFLNIIMSYFIF